MHQGRAETLRGDAANGRGGSGAVYAGLLAGATILALQRHRRRRDLERAPSLLGLHALITGGSRGLGFLLARELAGEGAAVTLLARDPSELDRARRVLAEEGAAVATRECDVTDREAVASVVRSVEEQIAPVDVLVNNAGLITVGPVETLTVDDYRASLDVMFWGMVHPTLAVVPGMIARGGGRIVNVTSIGGKMSVPHLSSYCAAKFAAVGFSESLHAELDRHGIRVTTVVPGLMRTGGHVNALFKGALQKEYLWFGLGASLPGISISGERAAREIVLAVKRGDAEYFVGWPAKIAARFHGVFPQWSSWAARLVDEALPSRVSSESARGKELEANRRSRVWKALVALGNESVRRFQEHRS